MRAVRRSATLARMGDLPPGQDALRRAPDASYEAQLAREPMGDADAAMAQRMIGRPLRGRSAVAVRCRWGLPAVLRVAPRLVDGTPFPTLFWLTCPLARKHVGRLEGEGWMAGLNERLEREPELAEAYARASERYAAARDRLGGPLPGNPSAGGMPRRVKCLHTVYAHELATADNPVGAWVADRVEPMPCPGPCVSADPEPAG